MSTDDTIILTSYSANWPLNAELEISKIKRVIPPSAWIEIEHIGSTAVQGCKAKPIIDIAIKVENIEDSTQAIEPLKTIDYIYWDENPDPKHLFFVKGMPPYGTGRTHHVHFFEPARFKEHIRFRDILRGNETILKSYQKLKEELSEKFKFEREAYTEKKADFIKGILAACLT